MRVVTWNVNGLRAALRKGFADHLAAIAPDALMLQEIRVVPEQLPGKWAAPEGWHVSWHPAEKKGYAGTSTWTREPHVELGRGLADGPDPQGRVLRARVDGVQLVNVYLPSGSSGPERQAAKDAWIEAFLPWATALAASDEPVVLGGDLNIAHTPDDIHNPTGNKKNSGFLPHERAWFTALLEAGWTDLLRAHVGPRKGPYSWWSNRGRARELDRGWRIDYLLGNAAAAVRAQRVWIVREAGLTVSDHAPVCLDLE